MNLQYKHLLAFFLLILVTLSLPAQDAPTPNYYHVHDYFHVAPGNHADYLAVEKVWKKIHQANIKAGKYVFWELAEIAIGSNTDYNYATRITVAGEKQLAAMLSGTAFQSGGKSILNDEEKAIYAGTGDTRTFVKREVYTVSSILPAEDFNEVRVAVHNFFDYPDGSNHRKHIQMEKEIWEPVHAARIEADEMLGWVLADKIMPWGAGESFHDVTVDLYKDLESYLNNASPIPQFEKVHADKDVGALMEKTDQAAILMGSEVRLILDSSRL